MNDMPDLSNISFEDALKELEVLVARLESGDAALDEAIGLYGKADALRCHCENRLKEAQAKIEKITLGGDGRPNGTTAFDA
jgi:exodeoxyribonuclease VII small subunit